MESFELILFFALIGSVINWFAWKRGYYNAPAFDEKSLTRISLISLIGVFAIYLGATMFLSMLIGKLFYSYFVSNPINMINWTQLFTTLISALLLFFFARAAIDKESLLKIWKDKSFSQKKSIGYDLGLGIVSWLIAFPLVMIIGELSDLFIYYVFGTENYDQVAVVYLKMTMQHPPLLAIALFVILIAAPTIEEFLFRGILQGWLKQHLGPKAAILLAALGFAFFHMAPSQGWGNISLIVSLFVFACFLGFVYEKQRSLFASIGLHIAFNAVSTLRILFTADS
jgi:membrane protease YdiL (CAAX protease family)